MTVTGIATRYAQAFVDALTGANTGVDPHLALAQLNDFLAMLDSSRDLDLVMLSPAVPVARKQAVVKRIAAAMGLDKTVGNFLLVLVGHRRITILREIAAEAALRLDAQLGFLLADITSAAPLSEAQQAEISASLAEVSGKQIRMVAKVDPELIGGVVALIGSVVYDGSVRGRLRAIGERLSASA